MKEKIDAVLTAEPNQTGKQIAKKLGLERKVVNSFLYSNKEQYSQNDLFQWRLK